MIALNNRQFTPGPWYLTITRGRAEIATRRKTVCTLVYDGRESEANARLLQQAWRLYAALDAAEQALEEATDILAFDDAQPQTHLESRDIEDVYTALVSVLVQVHEALRYANGELYVV